MVSYGKFKRQNFKGGALLRGYIPYKRIVKPLRLPRLSVEIGFGNGEFLVSLAKRHPERYFLGIELSGISVEKLLKRLREEGLRNVFCVRLDAYWAFYLLLSDEAVEAIYLNYPDPWFKKRHHRRRLTRPENLYLFARRLKTGGEILLRTDDRPFLEYTLESAGEVAAFEVSWEVLSPASPLTKYEAKWMAQGKTLYAARLRKVRPPKEIPHPQIEEVSAVFPVTVKDLSRLSELSGKTLRPREDLVLKIFRLWEHREDRLIEVLLSEAGYLQRFMIFARRVPGGWRLDVSGFSEVLRTRGLKEALEFLARELNP